MTGDLLMWLGVGLVLFALGLLAEYLDRALPSPAKVYHVTWDRERAAARSRNQF